MMRRKVGGLFTAAIALMSVAGVSAEQWTVSGPDAVIDPRRSGDLTIEGDVPWVMREAAGTTRLRAGSEVSHMQMGATQRVEMEARTHVSHLTLTGQAALNAAESRITYLGLNDQASAILDRVYAEHSEAQGSDVREALHVTLGPNTQLIVRASDVRFYNGSLHGAWIDGGVFRIEVKRNLGSEREPRFEDVDSMPPQIKVLDITDPSFACAKAATVIETRICASVSLSKMDRRLTNLYRRAMQASKRADQLRTEQRSWLVARNRCRNEDCLIEAYSGRLYALETLLGVFSSEFTAELCGRFSNSSSRRNLLKEVVGVEDINNDGKPERAKECWGGTMNTPCVEYESETGEPIRIETIDFEWKDYWTYGEALFRYGGRTFKYSSEDDALEKPSYVSYVSADNRERVVCDFENTITSVAVIDRSGGMCAAVANKERRIHDIEFHGAPPAKIAFDRSETFVGGYADVDIDNDGSVEHVGRLDFSSGGGRGCDFAYFELMQGEDQLSKDEPKRLRIASLQQLDGQGFWGRSCGVIRNRLFEFGGKVYYERNADNHDTDKHWVSVLSNGRVETVCEFDRKVSTKIKSLH